MAKKKLKRGPLKAKLPSYSIAPPPPKGLSKRVGGSKIPGAKISGWPF